MKMITNALRLLKEEIEDSISQTSDCASTGMLSGFFVVRANKLRESSVLLFRNEHLKHIDNRLHQFETKLCILEVEA